MSETLEEEFDALLARAREGDVSAQGEVLDRLQGFLRRLAAREMDSRLGRRVDVSDIVQDTYITALNAFEQFRGEQQDEFKAWLRTVHEHVVQNLARRHIRTQKRSITRENHFDPAALPQLAAVIDSTPSAKVSGAEQVIRLILALNSLPEDQCQAVRLRYCEGWELQRIGNEMQRSLPSIAGLLKRGLKTLRARLARDQ